MSDIAVEADEVCLFILFILFIFILDGNSEHVAHAKGNFFFYRRKTNPIFDCSRSNQMPYTDQIIEIVPHVRTFC